MLFFTSQNALCSSAACFFFSFVHKLSLLVCYWATISCFHSSLHSFWMRKYFHIIRTHEVCCGVWTTVNFVDFHFLLLSFSFSIVFAHKLFSVFFLLVVSSMWSHFLGSFCEWERGKKSTESNLHKNTHSISNALKMWVDKAILTQNFLFGFFEPHFERILCYIYISRAHMDFNLLQKYSNFFRMFVCACVWVSVDINTLTPCSEKNR